MNIEPFKKFLRERDEEQASEWIAQAGDLRQLSIAQTDAVIGEVIHFRQTRLLAQMLDAGVPIDHRNGAGLSALHLSCTFPDMGSFEMLVSRKADFETKDRFGRTPLHSAAENNNEHLCKRLIELGAKVDSTDTQGMTPLQLAATEGNTDVCLLLMRAGADPLLKHKGATASGLAGRKKFPETATQIKSMSHSLAALRAVNGALNSAGMRI
jgi:ankyrin repeat protein